MQNSIKKLNFIVQKDLLIPPLPYISTDCWHNIKYCSRIISFDSVVPVHVVFLYSQLMNLIFWYAGEIPIQHDEVGPTPFFLHADIRIAHDIDAFSRTIRTTWRLKSR